MEKFTVLTGLVAPLDRSNVDTDAIIPKQFLKSIYRTGYGPNCFDEWRYLDKGEPGMDCTKRPLNPDFVLNEPRYQGASILLARKNFGCGSSREHAPMVLKVKGVKCIIADSFARIFYRNAINIGLPVLEIGTDVEKIEAGDELDVDMAKGEIKIVNKNITIKTKPLPEFIQKIADCGGLINYLKGEQ